MRNPIEPGIDQDTLLQDKNFHIKFLQDNGVEAWYAFINGDTVLVPKDSLYAKIFPTQEIGTKEGDHLRKGKARIYQESVGWEAIGTIDTSVEPEQISIHTKVILNEGDSLGSFVKAYPEIVPKKMDKRMIIRQLEGDDDGPRDAGYNMFPGVKNSKEEAIELLKELFKAEKNNIYLIFLRTGYKGKPDPEEFLEFLLNEKLDLAQDQEESRETVLDALRSGLSDAFAFEVESENLWQLKQAVISADFVRASVEFDEKADYSWKVYIYLGNLLDFYIEAGRRAGGTYDHEAFSEIEGPVNIPNEYPYPKDFDISYAYESFRDLIHSELNFKGILP